MLRAHNFFSDLSSSAHGKDAELQTFLAKEQQRAQLQAMVRGSSKWHIMTPP